MIRFFDILFTVVALLLLSPLLLLLAGWVSLDSRGGPFYLQWRVGEKGKLFRICKFRTMHLHADQIRSLTVGNRDIRITRAGIFLRKYKLDELPQLFNILLGEMSLVGPRPELEKYVALYDKQQLKILESRPGITDIASLVFSKENQLLATTRDPESFYTNKIVPLKLRLNRVYCLNRSLRNYFTILRWSFLHLLHISCARLLQTEKACNEWMLRLPEPAAYEPVNSVSRPITTN